MMRKKAVQNLDSRQKTMIDNAFYYTNPPERQKVTLHYIVNLINNSVGKHKGNQERGGVLEI